MENKKCFYDLPDLVESLIINIIKEFNYKTGIIEFEKAISFLMHDINMWIEEYKIPISSSLISKVISLSITNILIWREKELMWNEDTAEGDKHLKLSHQLNGIRNQVKNDIAKLINIPHDKKTNINTDGLNKIG